MQLVEIFLFLIISALYIAALLVSFMYYVGGRIAGEADLVSSALSFYAQCTSNCAFVLYIATCEYYAPFLCMLKQ